MLLGDWIEQLRTLPDKSVHCCVTSPPYWGLRDYGKPGQLGLEKTPEEFVAKVVEGFHEVRRVLRDDGTCWVNLGDSYARNGGERGGGSRELLHLEGKQKRMLSVPDNTYGLKPKDLVGIPWRVAFALQADGWYLRADIIWHKPNPMPESVTDRPTKAHEYIFLLSKQERYYYDCEAVKEEVSGGAHARLKANGANSRMILERAAGKERSKPNPSRSNIRKLARPGIGVKNNTSFDEAMRVMPKMRNRRTVWTVATAAYKEAHFATFPPKLIKPCILAGCPSGGTVLDPFFGSGTTGQVSLELGRSCIGIDLSDEYLELAMDRTNVTPSLPLA